MTMPSSGPISFAQLQSEFGGSHPISLSEYRKVNAYSYVDTDDYAPNVPASGTVSLSNYRGSYDYVWVDPCDNGGGGGWGGC